MNKQINIIKSSNWFLGIQKIVTDNINSNTANIDTAQALG
jgi:hypothetical protein